jgi:hypothetical protein
MVERPGSFVRSFLTSALRRCRLPRISLRVLSQVAKTMLLFALLAGGAIWFGEALLPPHAINEHGAFWMQGHSPWAPDDGRCRHCGSLLVARVDVLSACRHCERCNVSFRHKSLPQTLEEQERIWK